MDFGTGRQAEELKVSGRVDAGTPLYMAPEVLAGLPASQSSDVYSVGVLLYHLVTSGIRLKAARSRNCAPLTCRAGACR